MRSTSRAKHYRDKRNHYVNQDQWQIIENVYEPIIDRETFENAQRILDNAPVRRPRGNGEIHPLSGLMYCKDCGSKMYIRIARYALTSSEEFEELIKKTVSAQQSDEEKKQRKCLPQVTSCLRQIDKVLNKLYEDYALGAIEQEHDK